MFPCCAWSPGRGNDNLYFILTMTWRGKQKRPFYPHFVDKKTGFKMLIDWSKFTLIEARVLIPILYIFHRTCLCERSEVLSLVHCKLLWRKKHVFCALRVCSVGHMILMAGVQGII